MDMDKDVPHPLKKKQPHPSPMQAFFIFYHLEPSHTNFLKYESIHSGKLLPTPICLDYVSLGKLAAFRGKIIFKDYTPFIRHLFSSANPAERLVSVDSTGFASQGFMAALEKRKSDGSNHVSRD